MDKALAELTPNKDTVATWFSAVREYYIKLTVRCAARPKTLKVRRSVGASDQLDGSTRPTH